MGGMNFFHKSVYGRIYICYTFIDIYAQGKEYDFFHNAVSQEDYKW